LSAPTVGSLPATVDGLLDAWLNVQKARGARFVPALESLKVEVPDFDGYNTVAWRKETIAFDPGAFMPFTAVDRATGETDMFWPPEGFPAPVSPEAESTERFPTRKLGSDRATVITEQGDISFQVFLRWSGPLEPMMPLLSGQDDMLAQAQMSRLAVLSATDLPGALRLAQVEAETYLFPGHSTVEHTWFGPTLKRNGLKHVLFKAEDRGLTVPAQSREQWDENTLNEALKQDAWRRWLREPVPIRRAWGAVGMFWTLLLDQLEAQRPFLECERCHRIISGKGDKRFCNGNDDRECFKGRRTEDQRRSRQGRTRRKAKPV
jgi:hypothetical protein